MQLYRFSVRSSSISMNQYDHFHHIYFQNITVNIAKKIIGHTYDLDWWTLDVFDEELYLSGGEKDKIIAEY